MVAYFLIINPLLLFLYSKYQPQKSENNKSMQPQQGENNKCKSTLKMFIPLLILILGPVISYGLLNWGLYVPISYIVYKIGNKMLQDDSGKNIVAGITIIMGLAIIVKKLILDTNEDDENEEESGSEESNTEEQD